MSTYVYLAFALPRNNYVVVKDVKLHMMRSKDLPKSRLWVDGQKPVNRWISIEAQLHVVVVQILSL